MQSNLELIIQTLQEKAEELSQLATDADKDRLKSYRKLAGRSETARRAFLNHEVEELLILSPTQLKNRLLKMTPLQRAKALGDSSFCIHASLNILIAANNILLNESISHHPLALSAVLEARDILDFFS